MSSVVNVNPVTGVITEQDISFDANQAELLQKAYQALESSVYSGLFIKTRFAAYFELISIQFDEVSGVLQFGFDQFNQKINDDLTKNPKNAADDLIDMLSIVGEYLQKFEWKLSIELIRSWIDKTDGFVNDAELMKALYISGFNVFYDRSGNNSLSGASGATNLIIEYGNSDSIRVLNFFKGNQYWINEIHFADKVVTHADLYQIEIPITVSATQYDTSWSGNVLIIQLSSASSPTSFDESDSFNQVQQLTSAMAAFGSQSTAMDGINSAANENYLGNLLVANN